MLTNGIFYRTWGDSDSPKTALLLHGLASSSITWRKLAKALTEEGYRVIAPDLSGHGNSQRTKHYTVEKWATEIMNLGFTPDLIVGHSLGGTVGARMSTMLDNKPELVLIDPVYRMPYGGLLLAAQQVFASTMLWRRYKVANRFRRNLPGVFRDELINLRRWDAHTIHGLKGDREALVKCLRGEARVLLLRAKDSFILPKRILTRKVGGSTILQQTDAAHNIHEDQFEDFVNRVRTFLTTTPTSSSIAV